MVEAKAPVIMAISEVTIMQPTLYSRMGDIDALIMDHVLDVLLYLCYKGERKTQSGDQI